MKDFSFATYGNCAGLDSDLMFPETTKGIEDAKKVCRDCMVRERPLRGANRRSIYNEGADAARTAPAHSPNLDERSEPMTERTRGPVALPESVEHGTRLAYRKYRCSCDECRESQTAAHRDYLSRTQGREVTPRRRIKVADWRDYVTENENGCLVWQGNIDPNGYARLGGKWAHRAVFEHEVGAIPDRHELDHVCENPPCVNPDHLDPVTKAEHVARTFRRLGKDDLHQSAAYLRTVGLTYREIAEVLDYTSKEGAHGAVLAAIRKGLVDPDDIPRPEPLSAEDCQDIMDLRSSGVPVSDIAEWYGIHNATASRISRGQRLGEDVA